MQDKIYKRNVTGRTLINPTSYLCVTYMREPTDEKNYLGSWFKRFHFTLARVRRQNTAAQITETKKQRYIIYTLAVCPFPHMDSILVLSLCDLAGNSLQRLFLSITSLMRYPQVCFSHPHKYFPIHLILQSRLTVRADCQLDTRIHFFKQQ